MGADLQLPRDLAGLRQRGDTWSLRPVTSLKLEAPRSRPDDPSMTVDPYRRCNGIYVPPTPVVHRDDEYHNEFFQSLCLMQRDHFWYRGRHRFLLRGVHRFVSGPAPRRVVDLGGGCGGWVDYLARHAKFPQSELALADSSEACA